MEEKAACPGRNEFRVSTEVTVLDVLSVLVASLNETAEHVSHGRSGLAGVCTFTQDLSVLLDCAALNPRPDVRDGESRSVVTAIANDDEIEAAHASLQARLPPSSNEE